MSVLVFIPMYNCAPQIPRVLKQLQAPEVAELIDGVLCVDNQSSDETVETAKASLATLPIRTRVLQRNDGNYGLGGSHKVAIEFARRENYSQLIVLHGDDQGAISDLVPYLKNRSGDETEFLMGARFMRGSRLEGYSLLRTIANRGCNLLFSLISKKRLYDLGSGLNLFHVAAFDDDFHIRFADDLTFNYYLILALAERRQKLMFFPLTWREDDQVSNAKLGKMGVQILRLLGTRVVNKDQFFQAEHRTTARETYPSSELGRWTE